MKFFVEITEMLWRIVEEGAFDGSEGEHKVR